MIKNNKFKLILSSILILSPILVGLIFWNELPYQMATHWGLDGNINHWSSKAFAVFGLPLILLVIHWVCIFFTSYDPKNKNQNKKVLDMVLWILPITSIFSNGVVYATAFCKEVNIKSTVVLLLGIMFIFLGNYMPKCKQNYTMGIKIKWTLANEENWNATHRFAGKLWVIGGLLIIACIFLPDHIVPWFLLVFIVILVVIPIIYSYIYYKKQVKAGVAPKKAVVTIGKHHKLIAIISTTIAVIIMLISLFICFTGNIKINYDDNSFTIEASYWHDLTVEYDSIENIEYVEDFDKGVRVYGFGSPKLSMGTFKSDTFGSYSIYGYTRCDSAVILTVDGKTLAINGTDDKETTDIYNNILSHISSIPLS